MDKLELCALVVAGIALANSRYTHIHSEDGWVIIELEGTLRNFVFSVKPSELTYTRYSYSRIGVKHAQI